MVLFFLYVAGFDALAGQASLDEGIAVLRREIWPAYKGSVVFWVPVPASTTVLPPARPGGNSIPNPNAIHYGPPVEGHWATHPNVAQCLGGRGGKGLVTKVWPSCAAGYGLPT